MTKLSVNINKIATLRNARGGNTPNVLEAALKIEQYGAQGITVHPRPDERHIRYQDVRDLKPVLTTEFNIEGNPTKEFVHLISEIKPHQVTLVPDAPEAITSNAGWDTIQHQSFLKEVITELKSTGARVSIFLDPIPKRVEYALKCGADRIELYTEYYASQYSEDKQRAIRDYIETAKIANNMGIGVNAGHDLNLENLAYFHQQIPGLAEVSIGHALISDALYFGLQNTIQMYLHQLK